MTLSPEVLVLIVTHNGADTIRDVFHALPLALAGVSQRTLIVDNNSGDHTKRLVENEAGPALEIISSKINMGVAAAYNLGLKQALKENIRWMFILDQDTICAGDCLRILLEAAQRLEKDNKRVGALCSTPRCSKHPDIIHYPYYWRNGKFSPVVDETSQSSIHPVDSSITSGTLYNTQALDEVEGFREEYFIDFVDHECHLRLKDHGWGMWWAVRSEVFHNLGYIQKMVDGRLWIEHKPFRYYYMARNMTEGYYRLGGVKSLFYFWVEALRQMRRIRQVSTSSKECSHFFMKGIFHALQGKSGPLASDH